MADSYPRRWWLRALALLALCGCCPAVMRWVGSAAGTGPQGSEPLGLERTHLGVARVPESTPLEEVRTHEWRAQSLTPPRYQVGYGLDEALSSSLAESHAAVGRRLHFRWLTPERFTWQASPGCDRDLRCVYAELMRSNAEPVRALGERFLQHIHTRQLTADEAAELILTFVQRIRYEQPEDQPFGVLPPALVPAQGRGDCDSKAVLAVMLLRQAGLEATVLYSDVLSHAAVGVVLPGRSGPSIRSAGRSWRYTEVTTEGWPLGMIPPQYDKPHLWRALPLPVVAAGPQP